MSEYIARLPTTQNMSEKAKCPWCSEQVSRDKYAEHLQSHYKKDEKKIVGPFPRKK